MIRHGLHVSAVGEIRQISLHERPELGVEVDGTSSSIVAEDVVDAMPQGVGRVVVVGDGGEEIRRDAAIQPGDDRAVILHPVGVFLRSNGAIYVVAKTILAEHGGNGAYPGGLVGLIEVEDDGDMRLDVDAVDN